MCKSSFILSEIDEDTILVETSSTVPSSQEPLDLELSQAGVDQEQSLSTLSWADMQEDRLALACFVIARLRLQLEEAKDQEKKLLRQVQNLKVELSLVRKNALPAPSSYIAQISLQSGCSPANITKAHSQQTSTVGVRSRSICDVYSEVSNEDDRFSRKRQRVSNRGDPSAGSTRRRTTDVREPVGGANVTGMLIRGGFVYGTVVERVENDAASERPSP
ncbi:hypothetical protein R3P38DRAFT_2816718 [Favolaschia claudopus]|uniref:Uncharacterized protein n=1 Tax=Favolaschia claudopus TaxID=2862362 RepID=A0AAV9YYH6_9AGAR